MDLGELITQKPRTELIEGLPFADYRRILAVNNSSLNALDVENGGCPARCHYVLTDGTDKIDSGEEFPSDDLAKESQALAFGRLYQEYVLERALFDQKNVVMTLPKSQELVAQALEEGSKTKATDFRSPGFNALAPVKRLKAQCIAEGGQLVSVRDMATMRAMAEALLVDPDIADAIDRPADREITILFGWPLSGGKAGQFLQCKARVDWIAEDDSDGIDLKTSRETCPARFAASMARYGYDRQSAFYSAACHAVGRKIQRFGFLAQEKHGAYLPALHWMPHDWMQYSVKELHAMTMTLAHHIQTGEWPGFGAGEILPPAWLEERILEGTN